MLSFYDSIFVICTENVASMFKKEKISKSFNALFLMKSGSKPKN